jgi:hypothetical protein
MLQSTEMSEPCHAATQLPAVPFGTLLPLIALPFSAFTVPVLGFDLPDGVAFEIRGCRVGFSGVPDRLPAPDEVVPSVRTLRLENSTISRGVAG